MPRRPRERRAVPRERRRAVRVARVAKARRRGRRQDDGKAGVEEPRAHRRARRRRADERDRAKRRVGLTRANRGANRARLDDARVRVRSPFRITKGHIARDESRDGGFSRASSRRARRLRRFGLCRGRRGLRRAAKRRERASRWAARAFLAVVRLLEGHPKRVRVRSRGAPPPPRREAFFGGGISKRVERVERVAGVLARRADRVVERGRLGVGGGDGRGGSSVDNARRFARAILLGALVDAPRLGVRVHVRSSRGRVPRFVRGARDGRERDGIANLVPKRARARKLPDERREVVRDARPGLLRERVRGGGVPLRLGACARALGGARARCLPRRLDGRVRAADRLEARARALLARRGSKRLIGTRAGRRERADIVVSSRGTRRHRSRRVHSYRRVRRVGVRRLSARRRRAVSRPRCRIQNAVSHACAEFCFWHFNPHLPNASSATRAHPPRALDHRRPEGVRAVCHSHSGARDIQRRGEERHEHAFVRAFQAPPAVQRQCAALFHLGAFGLCATTPVQSDAVHPREHAEASRRARSGGGMHHLVVGES